MNHPQHLSAEQKFLRTVMVSTFEITKPAAESATWFLTGSAAIVGLLVANADSVSKIVSIGALKGGLICLVISMMCGVIVRMLAVSIHHRIKSVEDLSAYLASEEGKNIMSQMSIPVEQLREKMAAPFLWPLNRAMLKGANDKDYLRTEKACARQLSYLVRWSISQQILAGIGLLIILLGF